MARNKFGAIQTIYNGIKYHSKKEAEFAKKLDILKKAKKIKKWDRQLKLPIVVNGEKICNYIMDFVVETKEGKTQYWEIKGYETQVWKLKWKLLKAQLKDSDIELIVQK
jgi:hypothetical protein